MPKQDIQIYEKSKAVVSPNVLQHISPADKKLQTKFSWFISYTSSEQRKSEQLIPQYILIFPLLFQTVHINFTGKPESLIHHQKNDWKELLYHLYK